MGGGCKRKNNIESIEIEYTGKYMRRGNPDEPNLTLYPLANSLRLATHLLTVSRNPRKLSVRLRHFTLKDYLYMNPDKDTLTALWYPDKIDIMEDLKHCLTKGFGFEPAVMIGLEKGCFTEHIYNEYKIAHCDETNGRERWAWELDGERLNWKETAEKCENHQRSGGDTLCCGSLCFFERVYRDSPRWV